MPSSSDGYFQARVSGAPFHLITSTIAMLVLYKGSGVYLLRSARDLREGRLRKFTRVREIFNKAMGFNAEQGKLNDNEALLL